jgi:hypothetical protein
MAIWTCDGKAHQWLERRRVTRSGDKILRVLWTSVCLAVLSAWAWQNAGQRKVLVFNRSRIHVPVENFTLPVTYIVDKAIHSLRERTIL